MSKSSKKRGQSQAAKRATELRRFGDLYAKITVRDALGLSDRQVLIYNAHIIHGRSLYDVADELELSYSTIAKESMEITMKIQRYFDPETARSLMKNS